MEAKLIKLEEDKYDTNWYRPVFEIETKTGKTLARGVVEHEATLKVQYGLSNGNILDLKEAGI